MKPHFYSTWREWHLSRVLNCLLSLTLQNHLNSKKSDEISILCNKLQSSKSFNSIALSLPHALFNGKATINSNFWWCGHGGVFTFLAFCDSLFSEGCQNADQGWRSSTKTHDWLTDGITSNPHLDTTNPLCSGMILRVHTKILDWTENVAIEGSKCLRSRLESCTTPGHQCLQKMWHFFPCNGCWSTDFGFV